MSRDDGTTATGASDQDVAASVPQVTSLSPATANQVAALLCTVSAETMVLGGALAAAGYVRRRWAVADAVLRELAHDLPEPTLNALLAGLNHLGNITGPGWLAGDDGASAAFQNDLAAVSNAVRPLRALSLRQRLTPAEQQASRRLERALADPTVGLHLDALAQALRDLTGFAGAPLRVTAVAPMPLTPLMPPTLQATAEPPATAELPPESLASDEVASAVLPGTAMDVDAAPPLVTRKVPVLEPPAHVMDAMAAVPADAEEPVPDMQAMATRPATQPIATEDGAPTPQAPEQSPTDDGDHPAERSQDADATPAMGGDMLSSDASLPPALGLAPARRAAEEAEPAPGVEAPVIDLPGAPEALHTPIAVASMAEVVALPLVEPAPAPISVAAPPAITTVAVTPPATPPAIGPLETPQIAAHEPVLPPAALAPSPRADTPPMRTGRHPRGVWPPAPPASRSSGMRRWTFSPEMLDAPTLPDLGVVGPVQAAPRRGGVARGASVPYDHNGVTYEMRVPARAPSRIPRDMPPMPPSLPPLLPRARSSWPERVPPTWPLLRGHRKPPRWRGPLLALGALVVIACASVALLAALNQGLAGVAPGAAQTAAAGNVASHASTPRPTPTHALPTATPTPLPATPAMLVIEPASVRVPCPSSGNSATLTLSDTGGQAVHWQISNPPLALSFSTYSGAIGAGSSSALQVRALFGSKATRSVIFVSNGGNVTVNFTIGCH